MTELTPEELKRRGAIAVYNDLSILLVKHQGTIQEMSLRGAHPETEAVIIEARRQIREMRADLMLDEGMAAEHNLFVSPHQGEVEMICDAKNCDYEHEGSGLQVSEMLELQKNHKADVRNGDWPPSRD